MIVGVNPELFQQGTEPVVQVMPKVAPTIPATSGKLVPVEVALSQGDTAAQGAAEQAAFNPMREANLIESFGAAASQWDTLNAWRVFKKPDFVPEAGFSPYKFLAQVPFQLSEVQQKRLNESKSSDEAGWLIGQWDDQRAAQRVSAAHPAAAVLAGIVDPAYLAVGGALGLASKAAQTAAAARTIGMVGQGALAAGVSAMASDVQPVTTQEFVANVLLNMAGGAFIADTNGKLIQKDIDLPTTELAAQARSIAPQRKWVETRAAVPAVYEDVVIPAGTPTRSRVLRSAEVPAKPAVYREIEVPGTADELGDIDMPVPRELETSKPNYGYKDTNFTVAFDNAIDKAAYIVAGKGKSKAHDAIEKWALAASGMDKKDFIALGMKVRTEAKAAAKAASGDTMVISKLYKGELTKIKGVVKKGTPATKAQELVSPEVPVIPAMWDDIEVPGTPARTERRIKTPEVAAEGRWEEIVNTLTPAEVEAHAETLGHKWGEKIAFNINKSMKSVNDKAVGAEVADLLVDDVLDYRKMSVEADKRAIHAGLGQTQQKYEDLLRGTMAERGHGTIAYLKAKPATVAAQQEIEDAVWMELTRREQLTRQGKPILFDDVDPKVKALADAVDGNMQRAAIEQTAGGVVGAEAIKPTTGYIPRRMGYTQIESIRDKYVAIGKTEKEAQQSVTRLLKRSIMNAGIEDDTLAYDIAASMIDRTLRKGHLEDGVFSSTFGKGTQAEIRDYLRKIGVGEKNLEKVAGILGGSIDEAGKVGHLKHRVDLDYSVSERVGNEVVSVSDLFDKNISTLIETYNHNVSGRVALSKRGIKTSTDVANLRSRYEKALSNTERAEKLELFDAVVSDIMGLPSGAKMNETLRLGQGYNRLISLGAGGIWQSTEYAAMARSYGMLKTLKYAVAEMPMFKKIMETTSTDKVMSGHLKDVLTNMAEQDMRLRPFIAKYEDNFDMPMNSRSALILQQAGQLVPTVNCMRMIHHHQARIASNLIVNTIQRAVQGEAKAAEMLARYGLKVQVMDKVAKNFAQHGMRVDAWTDGAWAAIRPVVAKMMDEAVLHARLGDMPAFFKFDPVGKFLGTYRGFTMVSHNKLLAGTMGRDGLNATAMLAAYQFPLALVAAQANSVASGKGPLGEKELVLKAMGQMGVLGFGNDLWSWVSGSKREFGSPALIPYDRAISALGSTGKFVTSGGEGGGKLTSDLMMMLPLVSDIPGYKALGNLVKE